MRLPLPDHCRHYRRGAQAFGGRDRIGEERRQGHGDRLLRLLCRRAQEAAGQLRLHGCGCLVADSISGGSDRGRLRQSSPERIDSAPASA